jgi:hypothetical protein
MQILPYCNTILHYVNHNYNTITISITIYGINLPLVYKFGDGIPDYLILYSAYYQIN